MPRFDPPPPNNLDLTARVAALEARVASLERAIAIGIDGSVTIAARGPLKLSSVRSIDFTVATSVVKVDPNLIDVLGGATRFNTQMLFTNTLINAPIASFKCDSVNANLVAAQGRRL
jgi:hypothetical protein